MAAHLHAISGSYCARQLWNVGDLTQLHAPSAQFSPHEKPKDCLAEGSYELARHFMGVRWENGSTR